MKDTRARIPAGVYPDARKRRYDSTIIHLDALVSDLDVSKKLPTEVMMSNLCKNCSSETTDLYCAHCGQSTSIKRIDWAFCLKEFIFNNLTFHKGIFFTIKSLIVNPKKMVEDYLSGKRIRYTSAVHFFLFILIFKGILTLITRDVDTEGPYKLMINGVSSDFNLRQYMKPMLFIFTSISSLGNYLVYRSRKFNLPEHFFLNFYIIGMSILLTKLYTLITWNKFPDFRIVVSLLVIVSYYIRMFYDKKIRIVDFLKGIWCMTLNLTFSLVLVIIGAIIYGISKTYIKI